MRPLEMPQNLMLYMGLLWLHKGKQKLNSRMGGMSTSSSGP